MSACFFVLTEAVWLSNSEPGKHGENKSGADKSNQVGWHQMTHDATAAAAAAAIDGVAHPFQAHTKVFLVQKREALI